MTVVSACLAGIRCRYDGKVLPVCARLVNLVKQRKAILVCPEQLGGLPTPRMPAEKRGNKVVTKSGRDVTENFKIGAEEALKIAKMAGCSKAILKSKSPSCGSGLIYDGTFSGTLTKGDGVFAKLCKDNGIEVLTEKEI